MTPGMTVGSLMGGGPEADSAEAELDPTAADPAADDQEQQTMTVLAEEFRSAPVQDAVEALEQLVKMIVRKQRAPQGI